MSDSELNRLWELLQLHNTNRIDYNDRKWETIKLFHGAYALLLTAGIAATITAKRFGVAGDPLVIIFISAAPILMLVMACFGTLNLLRESELLCIEEYQMFKLAKLLGLDQEVPDEKRFFKKDAWLLPAVWREPLLRLGRENFEGTLEEAAKLRARGHRFWRWFNGLFLAEAILAVVLLASVIFISTPW
jgi:hypothetical protein